MRWTQESDSRARHLRGSRQAAAGALAGADRAAGAGAQAHAPVLGGAAARRSFFRDAWSGGQGAGGGGGRLEEAELQELPGDWSPGDGAGEDSVLGSFEGWREEEEEEQRRGDLAPLHGHRHL